MIRRLVATVVCFASLPAFAGPNAAVFCNQSEAADSAIVFKAFDIALREGVILLEFEGQHSKLSESQSNFTVRDVRDFKSHLVERKESSATVAYTDQAQRRMQIVAKDDTDVKLARVISITYKTSVADGTHAKRKGSVILKLQEGEVEEIKFEHCYYEGALVDTWKKIWIND